MTHAVSTTTLHKLSIKTINHQCTVNDQQYIDPIRKLNFINNIIQILLLLLNTFAKYYYGWGFPAIYSKVDHRQADKVLQSSDFCCFRRASKREEKKFRAEQT